MVSPKPLPTPAQAADGAVITAANAANLLGDADLLADAGRFSSALSLTVLAFEESVKTRTLGAIMTADGRPLGFSDHGLRKIIYGSHRARHTAGFFQHLAAATPSVYGKWMLGMTLTPAEAAALPRLIKLVGRANARKQSGFYADFDPEAGTWADPRDISRSEFEAIRSFIGEFITETQRQLDASQ
jgi:AbiV family abortive infection protein